MKKISSYKTLINQNLVGEGEAFILLKFNL